MDQPPKNTKEESLLEIEKTIKDAEGTIESAVWTLSQKKAIINPNDDERMEIADLEESINFLEKEKRNIERRRADILNTQNENPEPEPQNQPQEVAIEENSEDVFGLKEETPDNLQPELEIEPASEISSAETPKVTPVQAQPEPAQQQEEKEELRDLDVVDFIKKINLEPLLPNKFNQLDNIQQIKIIQDLKRRIVDIVKSDAQTQYSEELKGKWKKVRSLIMKERDLKNLEKSVFEKFISSEEGRKLIENDLKILTDRTAGRYTDLENGKAYFNYFTGESINIAGPFKANYFNEKAHGFINMPYEWGQEKSGKNKKAYDEAKEEYEEARRDILEQRNITSREKAKLMQEMLETDNLVKMEQLLNTHPEFEKALKDFEETAKGIELAKNAKKFLKSITLERGGLMAAGAGARTLAKGAVLATGMTGITAIAAPVIGGVVGYYRGKMRAKETLTERQIKARRGEKDESKEKGKIIEAERLTNGLNKMIGEAEKATEKEDKLAKLSVLIEYTQDQIEKGQVNFGDSKNSLNNQFDLINNLNRAIVLKESNSPEIKRDLENKINMLLKTGAEKRFGEISKAQEVFIKKQARNSAMYGAGFALAGYGVRSLGEYFGWWGHAGEVKTDTPKITKEIKPEIPVEKEIVAPAAKAAEVFKGESITFEKGKGGIQGIIDLRFQIKKHYNGDYSGAPQNVQDFMKEKNVMNLAKKLGFFDPEAKNGEESALIQEGSVLKFDGEGNLLFGKPDADGNVPVLEKYHGRMFDSDHRVHATENTEKTPESVTEIKNNSSYVEEKEPEITTKTEANINHEQEVRAKIKEEFEKETTVNKETIEIKNSELESKINQEITTSEEIVRAMSIHQHNIEYLFPGNKIEKWETLKDFNAKDWVHEGKMSEDSEPFIKYFNKLINTTGLKPKNDWLIFPETIESYVKRALQEAARTGKLDKVKLE